MAENIIHPFLKWAGGKRWLTAEHASLFPTRYARYIEPFLGSGAVYFFLKPETAILADVNEDLIATYIAIRDNHQKVESHLRHHHNRHSRDYYYFVRRLTPRTPHTRAARLIYLNRTCWNGLYRVNLRGEFNVPVGTKQNVVLSTDAFGAIAALLKPAQIASSDFAATIAKAERRDFLFVDPPYTVKHNFNGFVKYNEKIFSWDDQVRLSKALLAAQRRGVQIFMTNADHASIRHLYRDNFDLRTVTRKSVISGDVTGRAACNELLIRG